MASWEYLTVRTPNGDRIIREYKWEYDNYTFSWEASLPKVVYDIQKRRHRIYDYGAYIADTFTQELFEALVSKIRSVASKNNYDRLETVEFASRFVQSLPYTRDSVSTGYNNYPRYPIETLVDETGDCEDSSLLLAAILYNLDYNVGLLEFDSHLGVGVQLNEHPGNVTFTGVEYSYIETTQPGWDPGELPSRYEGESVEFHHIDDSPSLYSGWAGETQGNQFDCGGSINNLGNGTARDITFQLILNDQNGNQMTGLQENWPSIESGGSVTWSDQIYIEPNKLVTPEWQLGVEGLLHDKGEEESQWT